ncbi:MAG: hypothetical protein GOP50_10260 [Candidatus Heimdallarchaeota archaeon]|nr:hypothetical protein [Candidatus Heimdallarchaeota archaeon]
MEILILQNTEEYCDPIIFKLRLGEVEEVEFSLSFTEFDIQKIQLGMQLYFEIEITAVPIYLGIAIQSLVQYFDFEITISSAS